MRVILFSTDPIAPAEECQEALEGLGEMMGCLEYHFETPAPDAAEVSDAGDLEILGVRASVS